MDNQPSFTPDAPQQNSAPTNNIYNPGGEAGGDPVPVYSSHNTPGPKGMSRGRLFAIAGAASLVVLGTGGYVLGYYVPNRPSNVFKTALVNTGKGYDSLVNYANDKDTAKKFDKSVATGDFKFATHAYSTDGTFKANTDQNNASFSGDVGLGATRLKVEGVVKDVANSDSPDAYLKFSGIKGLGAQAGIAELDTLDNQWITVDHTLFDTIAKQTQQAGGLDPTSITAPTKDDVAEAVKVVGQEADKYIFTSDDASAVLTMDKFVGKETVDGKSVNHYKVKANKENLKKFARELGTNLDKTQLNDWAKKSYNKSLSELIDVNGMIKTTDDIKPGDNFDLWVNTKTKLVHKVRFAEKENGDKNYIDFGLNYDGGDEKPFFITTRSNTNGSDSTTGLKLTVNTKTNELKLALNLDEKIDSNSENDTTGTLNISVKPTTDSVDVSVPTGAITLSEALDRIGLGGYLDFMLQGLSQSQAAATGTDPFTITQ